MDEIKPYRLPNDIFKAMRPLQLPPKWEPVVGEIVFTFRPFKIYRELEDGKVEMHDDQGNALTAFKTELKEQIYKIANTDFIMKAMKDAVMTVAKQLAKANNTVTTLEIKNELRRDFPYYFWQQQTVSDYMSQLAADGVFVYSDNGTFRVYSLATPAQVAATAGPVSTTVSKTLAKISGKIASKAKPVLPVTNSVATKRGRGRPRKNMTIYQKDVLQFATASNFEEVIIDRKGYHTIYTKADIRAQKKSPVGYISRSLDKVVSIRVGNDTYLVI